MLLDSTLIAALLLLAAALYAALCGEGVYLRFAAALCAALAVAAGAGRFLPGLESAVALPALPLIGAALALSTVARLARPVPALLATLVLLLALGGGFAALFGAGPVFALLPLLLGGLVVAIAALSRGHVTATLAGALMTAAACAFLARGVALPGLVLLAAVLGGFALQTRASNSSASRLSFSP